MIGTTRKGVSLMNTKTMTTLLRAVLLAAAVLCGIFFLWFLPSYGQGCSRRTRNSPGPTGLIWAWLFAPAHLRGHAPAGASSAASAPRRGAFTRRNARDMGASPSGLCRCADLSGGDVRAGLYGGRQRPLTIVITPWSSSAAQRWGSCAMCSSRLIGDAAALREENDMTI